MRVHENGNSGNGRQQEECKEESYIWRGNLGRRGRTKRAGGGKSLMGDGRCLEVFCMRLGIVEGNKKSARRNPTYEEGRRGRTKRVGGGRSLMGDGKFLEGFLHET